MSVAELVLDYIQALIWPALIAVGVFWLFRSQARRLFDNVAAIFDRSRAATVEFRGLKLTLEQAAEVLKETVEETREELAKAEDPQERERTAEKLQREAAALSSIERFQARNPYTYIGSLGGAAWAGYLGQLRRAALRAGLSKTDMAFLEEAVLRSVERDTVHGFSVEEALDRQGHFGGSPDQVVEAWIRENNRRDTGWPSPSPRRVDDVGG